MLTVVLCRQLAAGNGQHVSWGEFYGESRLAHTIQLGERRGIDWDTSLFDRVIARLVAGEFDDDQPPARLHGCTCAPGCRRPQARLRG